MNYKKQKEKLKVISIYLKEKKFRVFGIVKGKTITLVSWM